MSLRRRSAGRELPRHARGASTVSLCSLRFALISVAALVGLACPSCALERLERRTSREATPRTVDQVTFSGQTDAHQEGARVATLPPALSEYTRITPANAAAAKAAEVAERGEGSETGSRVDAAFDDVAGEVVAGIGVGRATLPGGGATRPGGTAVGGGTLPPEVLRVSSSTANAVTTQQSSAPPPPPPEPYLSPKLQIAPPCMKSGAATLTVSAERISATSWKGWGTSLAWYAQFIGALPNSKLTPLLDLLFSPSKGLGLNIVRYNIGAGSNWTYSPQFNRTDVFKYRDMPNFKDGPSLLYDWSKDAEQRKVLFGARARGADTFIAFANSPPWWMTISRDSAGAAKPKRTNLASQNYGAFVEYLVDVVEQYATNPQWNLTFQYLEPFNEPDEGFWRRGNGQEGCFFSPKQLAAITPRAQSMLAQRGLKTVVVGVDSWAKKSPLQFAAMSADTIRKLGGIHVHGYVFPGSPRTKPGALARQGYGKARTFSARWQKETWVSEWGPAYASGSDLGVSLFMARQIIESVNFMGATAWCYWQPIDAFFRWSVIFLSLWESTGPLTYEFSKKYHILKQFTTHAPKGSFTVSVGSTKDCRHGVAAFYNPDGKSVAVFMANQGSSRSFTLQFQGFKEAAAGSPVTFSLFRTSGTEDLVSLGPPPSASLASPVRVTSASRSFTSLVISNVVRA